MENWTSKNCVQSQINGIAACAFEKRNHRSKRLPF